ncbi:hypothetical protein BDZ45DRAFT_807966 [Acephala macrosclerotiorum]|nr:hypothetical protein BDZ45DRAFT_807966 [Acephala macrosclerotiorum]
MFFNTLSIFGLIATAAAAPQLHSRFQKEVEARGEAITHAARGINWPASPILPRANKFGNSQDRFNGNYQANVQITQEQITILEINNSPALEQEILEQEIALSQAIQLQILAQQELQFAIDNIRINTFNNLNSNVNTVIVIVTQVVDNRNSGNNNRYLVRQLQSNSAVQEQVFVQINEQATMTIANDIPSSVFNAAQASGTGFAAPNLGSYTPGGNISLQPQGLNLLPAGVSAPSFGNAQNFNDPALIIQPNVQAFVQVGQSNQFSVAALEAQVLG